MMRCFYKVLSLFLMKFSVLLYCFFYVVAICAQTNVELHKKATYLEGKSKISYSQFQLSNVETSAFEEEDRINDDLSRFAISIESSINVIDEGNWTTNGNYQYCRLKIKSEEAKSLSLIFDEFDLPEYALLNVCSDEYCLEIKNPNDHTNKEYFAVQPLKGDHLEIEMSIPVNVSRNKIHLNISNIVHGYRDFGDAGSCHLNAACPEGAAFSDQKRSVVMTIVDGNTRWCTGTLLNNTREDGIPYFLTSNKALTGDENTWIFIFNYQSTSCLNEDVAITNALVGADILARNDEMDFALLKLKITPPSRVNAYYAGWDVRDYTDLDSVYCFHHPKGDIKKMAFADTNVLFHGVNDTATNYIRVNEWLYGGMETGSLGAPLFNKEQRVIGTLSWHPKNCGDDGASTFGKVKEAYDLTDNPSLQLKYWLNPDSLDIYYLDGLSLIEPQSDFDLVVTRVEGVKSSACIDDFRPLISFQNMGEERIDSVYLHIQFDDSFWVEKYRLGIDFLDITDVKINKIFTDIGLHQLQVRAEAIHDSLIDSNLINSTVNFVFEIKEGNYLNLVFKSDLSPEENYIEVFDEAQELVFSYDQFEANSIWQTDLCLPDGCYQLWVYDEWGDGICCDNGNGYWAIFNQQGVALENLSQFTDSFMTEVCVGNSSIYESTDLNIEVQQKADIIRVNNPMNKNLIIQAYDLMGRRLYFSRDQLSQIDIVKDNFKRQFIILKVLDIDRQLYQSFNLFVHE